MLQSRTWTKTILTSLLTAGLLLPGLASAKPAWIAKAPQSRTGQRGLFRATSAFNRAQAQRNVYRVRIGRQMSLYRSTGNLKQKQWAQANAARSGWAKVKMMQAQVRGLQIKAKLANKAKMTDQANEYMNKAARLSSSAERLVNNLQRFQAANNIEIKGTLRAANIAGRFSSTADKSRQAVAGQAGVTQQAASHSDQVLGSWQLPGLRSWEGKRMAKLQMQTGNFTGAVDTFQRMKAQPNRGGVKGLFDRYRKWSVKRSIVKQSYKAGVQAARTGDMELARDALTAMTSLRKPGFFTNRKVNAFATSAIKGARKMARSHQPEEAKALLGFARSIQQDLGRVRPTLRYRLARRSARGNLLADLKLRAKQGNLDAFRSGSRLYAAYAREDGKPLSKGEKKQLRTLYWRAVENSVPRALDDAKLLLSGRMGYVNVEEAASRYAYAHDTANHLAQLSVSPNLGQSRSLVLKAQRNLSGRKVRKQFDKTRSLLVKAVQEQTNPGEPHRIGRMRRIFEKIFVQPHNRTQPYIAPVDSAWMARQQRIQQQEMAQMAAGQQLAGQAGF